MESAGKILSIEPLYAIPGGEIVINCDGFDASYSGRCKVFIDENSCRIVAASSNRIMAVIPEEIDGGRMQLTLEAGGVRSAPFAVEVGKLLTAGMHIVANPAIDPTDDSIILTRSGPRGQQLASTLFRLNTDGILEDLGDAILNPTGIAFDKDGEMYVTSRAQGEVYAVSRQGSAAIFATGLGIATTLAFDRDNVMFVGDRTGTIYRVHDFSNVETFAIVEPSVAAHHIAFGPSGELFLTAPGFASKDAIHVIDSEGFSDVFYRGSGRPQGLAIDTEGNIFAAACLHGRHGVVRVSGNGSAAEHFVAGNDVIGLCFTRNGEMIVATSDSVYSIPCGIRGMLLG